MKALIEANKAKLEELKATSLDEKERLLELRMLEAKIKVQESLYGMNLVKTLGMAGAAISGTLNLLGIRLSKSAPLTQTKVEVTGEGITVESRPLRGRGRPESPAPAQKPTQEVVESVSQAEDSGMVAYAVDHAYVAFALVVVLVVGLEFLSKKFKKKEETHGPL